MLAIVIGIYIYIVIYIYIHIHIMSIYIYIYISTVCFSACREAKIGDAKFHDFSYVFIFIKLLPWGFFRFAGTKTCVYCIQSLWIQTLSEKVRLTP